MTPDLNEVTRHMRIPVTNKNYALDVGRTLQYSRWLLDLLGVWPMVKKNPNKWEIYGSIVLIATSLMLLASAIIPITLHVWLTPQNSKERMSTFSQLGFCTNCALKYCATIFHRRLIKDCVEHVEVDWMSIGTKEHREIMKRNMNFANDLTVSCAIFMYSGGLMYIVVTPLWQGDQINEFNETVRPLIFSGYDRFVNSQASPIYEIVFCSICISTFIMYTTTIATCNLAATFVAHASGQIEIAIFQLENLFAKVSEKNDIIRTRVSFIIYSHVRVLRFKGMIEIMLREICLVEIVASTIVICFVEYTCVKAWDSSNFIAKITYVIMLVSLSFNTFIFCQIGEFLKEQCHRIGMVAYAVDWYRLPGKTGLALVMILAMSNYPRKLTAGGIIELSISTFGTILKTSASYFNMLRAMTD